MAAMSSVGISPRKWEDARETKAEATWGRHGRWVLSVWVAALCLGCSSLLIPSGPSERDIQAMIDRNTRNLLRLQTDLFEEYVLDIMGPPQRLEGYPWGTVWLYRTALTKQPRAAPETDFTPLVFDRRGVLVGWGRNFLTTYSHRQSSVGGGAGGDGGTGNEAFASQQGGMV